MIAEPGYLARWPLRFVVDSRGESVRWAIIGSRIVSPSRQAQLAELRRAGFRFVGMSSDGVFPADTAHDPLDYSMLCEAWCHCFRDADNYVPPGVPRALLSLSDFTDYMQVTPDLAVDGTDSFELVYVGAVEPWKQQAKNWPLARRCIPRLCEELGLRALVVGAPLAEAAALSPAVAAVGALPRRELLGYLARARFLFAPNAEDASPRVLAEALCVDRPILVHRGILGGWKYVTAFTGELFEGEHDVVAAARACLAREASPRRWFRANHGPYLAGRRLLELLRSLGGPALSERSHLAIVDRLDAPP